MNWIKWEKKVEAIEIFIKILNILLLRLEDCILKKDKTLSIFLKPNIMNNGQVSREKALKSMC